MRWFSQWVLHNWGLKLLALGLALLLWTTYTAEPLSEMSFVVPIEIRDIPDAIELASEVPTQAQVRVRARSALLHRLKPNELAIDVNLADAEAGEKLVPLTTEKMAVPYGATVVRITPTQILLHLVSRRQDLQKPSVPVKK